MLRRVAFLLASTAILVGACSSTPSVPALTDPKAILTGSAASLKDLKTVHFAATVDGEIKLDLGGTGTGSAIKLAGTTVEGDLDMAGKKFHAALNAPAMFGLTADLIVLDQVTYTKVSLMSDKYQKSTSTGDSAGTGDPQKAIDELTAFLGKPEVAPVKKADEKCGDQDCYHVSLPLTSNDISGAVGGALGSSAPSGTGTVDIWVQKNDLRPVKLVVLADGGDQGKLTVTMTLSKFNSPVTVTAPPDDQVEASPAP
jgi:hypothetical protein